MALLIKSVWRAIHGNSIWSAVINCKYIDGYFFHKLLCMQVSYPHHISAIWWSFKKVMVHMSKRLAWLFKDGSRIPITFNKIIALPYDARPSQDLQFCLARGGFHFLAQTIREWSFDAPVFKSAEKLGLNGMMVDEWDRLRDSFRAAGFC